MAGNRRISSTTPCKDMQIHYNTIPYYAPRCVLRAAAGRHFRRRSRPRLRRCSEARGRRGAMIPLEVGCSEGALPDEHAHLPPVGGDGTYEYSWQCEC